jgi:plasmid stability protein
MAQVVVRGLETDVVERLKERAKSAGRSLEAELRRVLSPDCRRPRPGRAQGSALPREH